MKRENALTRPTPATIQIHRCWKNRLKIFTYAIIIDEKFPRIFASYIDFLVETLKLSNRHGPLQCKWREIPACLLFHVLVSLFRFVPCARNNLYARFVYTACISLSYCLCALFSIEAGTTDFVHFVFSFSHTNDRKTVATL